MIEDRTEAVWSRRFWQLLGVVTLLRVGYLAIFPYDLVGDEAYYWDWGRQLDWGYFSKPPMIGWLMGFFNWLGGGTLAGIKLAPILFGAGTCIWLFLLARRLYGARAGFWTAALMMASLGNVALNVLFTIDAPLLFCWSGALYVFWRLAEPGEATSRAGWAVVLILLLGGGVLSKQMMLVFWVMALIFLAIDREARGLLKHPATWLVALVALLFLLPPLWWNWQNDWITFVHMEDHFQPGKTDLVEVLLRPVVFVLVQIALGSPITGILLFGLLVAAVLGWRVCGRRERYLLIFSVPGLVAVLVLSLRQNINPNWPAVYFPAAYILLGAWGVGAFASSKKGFERLRWLFKPGVYLGAALAVVAYAMPFAVKAGGWEGMAKDPGRRMEGWSEVGREAGAFYADFPGGEPQLVIAGGHRHTAAELAFYLPGQPRVYRWFPYERVESQYEIWGGPKDAHGKNALILWPGEVETLPEDINAAFAQTKRLGDFTVQPGTKNAKGFTAFAGNDFKQWKP
ncbi:MAG: ArnT family glycosyltransferase [Puniceicoccales bacterium]